MKTVFFQKRFKTFRIFDTGNDPTENEKINNIEREFLQKQIFHKKQSVKGRNVIFLQKNERS